MTTEEIFTKLLSHMAEGTKTHDQLAKAFDFLKLEGFARMHDYHQCEEKLSYLLLYNYYSHHYHRLLKPEESIPSLIPDTWFKYTSFDVDSGTKRNAVKELYTQWVSWEKETKTLYQEMRQELYKIGEVSAALELDSLIIDVTEELKHAEAQLIRMESIGYDLSEITSWQNQLKKKYKKKIGW